MNATPDRPPMGPVVGRYGSGQVGYAGGVPVASVVRSGFVEGRHHGSVVVLDAAGAVIASVGDPRGAVFPRSSNKPMQAAAMVRCGLRLADPADLAMVAASHRGEPFHIDRVRAMLRAGGLAEDALRCPPDRPIAPDAYDDVVRAGQAPAAIYMNCSGKHTGMLRTCQAAGWTLEDYLLPDHPLQKSCRTTLEELTGETVAAIGVDGCGAPVLAISLTALARGLLAVVTAEPGSPERLVADAMREHPELVSGTGAPDAQLMRGLPGALSKGGAEGVWAIAVPGVGAVALKIDDGAARATMPVLVEGLSRLGVSAAALGGLAESPILGGGARVGGVTATIRW